MKSDRAENRHTLRTIGQRGETYKPYHNKLATPSISGKLIMGGVVCNSFDIRVFRFGHSVIVVEASHQSCVELAPV